MIPSLEPRLSSSYSSLAFRTVSGEKLDESLGSRIHDSSTTAAADVGGEYTSVRLAGQWGVASFSFALVSQLRWFRVCVPRHLEHVLPPGGPRGPRNCIPKRDTYSYIRSATLHDYMYLPPAKALGNNIAR